MCSVVGNLLPFCCFVCTYWFKQKRSSYYSETNSYSLTLLLACSIKLLLLSDATMHIITTGIAYTTCFTITTTNAFYYQYCCCNVTVLLVSVPVAAAVVHSTLWSYDQYYRLLSYSVFQLLITCATALYHCCYMYYCHCSQHEHYYYSY
jgi:hypothetical protein